MKTRLSEEQVRILLCDATGALIATRIGITGTPRDFNRDNPAACEGCVFQYDQEYWVLTTIGQSSIKKETIRYLDSVVVRHILVQGIPSVDLFFTEGEAENGVYRLISEEKGEKET